MTDDAKGILVIRGTVAKGLDYGVLRDDGVTLGEDEIVALDGEDPTMTGVVSSLLSDPEPDAAAELSAQGIEYVVLPAPADGSVAATLDATGGLAQASAENRATRAWQVEEAVDPNAVDGPRSWLRIVLLVVQGLAIVVVAVLSLPTTDRGGRRE